MHVSTIVLGCILLGQVSAADNGTTPGDTAPDGTDSTVVSPPQLLPPLQPLAESPAAAPAAPPVAEEPRQYRTTPPEMVADALVLPPGSKLTGRPLTLLTVLSSGNGRTRRIEAVHAYWRLAEAVAVYHFVADYDRLLREQTAFENVSDDQAALLRSARASSSAMLHEAEAVALAAQHELAGVVLLPPDAPLPLPADRPHAGPYATHFDRLFAARKAPTSARLIDRTLPIRRQAIEGRAAAVVAARDAFEATLQAYRQGRADLPGVLTCLGQTLRQQQAMMRLVGLYNRDIADYVLAVVSPGTGPQELVGMLIRPTREPLRPLVTDNVPRRPAAARQPSGVEPARFEQPVPTPAVRPKQGVPTPAKRETAPEPPKTLDDSSASDAGWAPSGSSPQRTPTLGPLPPDLAPLPPKEKVEEVKEEETEEGEEEEDPQHSAAATEPEVPTRRVVPVEAVPLEPIPMKVEKPVAEDAAAVPALYSGLVETTPGRRTKQLTLALHWDRSLPADVGSPIGLAEALRRVAASQRTATIDAYWQARQRAAEYQAVVFQAELIDDLIASQEDRRGLLRLRSAKQTTAAALHEAHAALVEAQFELAGRLGFASDARWPVPGTVPHSGPYLLKLDAQPRELVESWPLKRLAATIPVLWEGLQDHATAVVEADTARAAAAARYAAAGRSVEAVLASISRQTEETFAFLQAQTDYNRAIAEYALTVLPAEAPAERVVSALVVP